MDLNSIIEKAKHSKFQLKLFNMGLNRMIPFNRPHGFKVVEIADVKIRTCLPYKKKNLNHIKGLHACALATLCEFTTGLYLISKMGFTEYRIILNNLSIDYQYQGKTDVFAEFSLSDKWIEENIVEPLKSEESVLINCPVEIFDTNENLVCSAMVEWQLKEWKKVKTKV